MKKLVLAAMLVVFSHVTNAQSSEEVVSRNIDSTTDSAKLESVDDKLAKQDADIKALKKDNELLKTEMKQMKSSFPNSKRKFTVSRVGSKQVVIE